MAANETWVRVKPVGSTMMNPNGTVRSLNPSHNEPPYGPYHWEERPANTSGGYEVCAVNGQTVQYNPTGEEPLLFGFIEHTAHTDGYSLMTESPLKIETVPL